MRFPVPVGDPRHGTCPACTAPTVDVEPSLRPALPEAGANVEGRTVGVLDNIRSAMNVGTMLRAADGARVDHLYLAGLSPAGDHPKVAKTALGAERTVTWSHVPDAVTTVTDLKARGTVIWAFEVTNRAVPFDEVDQVPEEVAVVVGNERSGVDPGVLRLADRHISLPMAGAKTTLNVGVAFGVAIYGIRSIRART
ncbi:MAG: TrmH family RNA methyltransferase [Actinomycetota bacterium]